jgi:hypothetical protein
LKISCPSHFNLILGQKVISLKGRSEGERNERQQQPQNITFYYKNKNKKTVTSSLYGAKFRQPSLAYAALLAAL